jgi:hypothetical protein
MLHEGAAAAAKRVTGGISVFISDFVKRKRV